MSCWVLVKYLTTGLVSKVTVSSQINGTGSLAQLGPDVCEKPGLLLPGLEVFYSLTKKQKMIVSHKSSQAERGLARLGGLLWGL